MFARTLSGTVYGFDGHLVHIEVDISRGLPLFDIVGLPDASMRESRDRVRTAIRNAGLPFPTGRIIINLAPADLPKTGPASDLAIALAILAASGVVPAEPLSRLCVVGELSLDGRLRTVPGVLPIALAAARRGLSLLAPADAGAEATLVPGLPVTAVRTLRDAITWVRGEGGPAFTPAPLTPKHDEDVDEDLGDVAGQSLAKRALTIAAAGGHNLLLVGPPGIGKTMLARRLVTILPPLDREEYLDVCRMYSIAGLLDAEPIRHGRRPFRAPHHSATRAGLLGGMRGVPGEVALAHHGVLFLDEVNEFPRALLESLRQPLEEGVVVLARLPRALRFPARFTMVAAANPCPCGFYGDVRHECRCRPHAIEAYAQKLSGPVADRIDLHVSMAAPTWEELDERRTASASSGVRGDVMRARDVQTRRFRATGVRTNSRMSGSAVRRYAMPDAAGRALLRMAVDKFGISARAVDRTLKVARTIADLAGEKHVTAHHIQEALAFRRPADRASPEPTEHIVSPDAGGVRG